MTIEEFKTRSHREKLDEVRYHGELLGPYERLPEPGAARVPGDIYQLHDFWVYVSEDEKTIIPTRRNPLPPAEETE